VKLNKPIVYLITEGKATVENFSEQKANILEIVQTASENEISLIQIREKHLPARLVFELASEAAKITNKTDTKLLINDRADIAFAANADGVHLTENSISAEIIRKIFPKGFIIGVSTHSLANAEIARQQEADFVTFSPIFASPNKGESQGLEKLREVCEKLESFPVVALGGIDQDNYKSVFENGASGFAAIRFLNDTKNLRKLTGEVHTKKRRPQRSSEF
jgi:thiamine-phosphate pyrophosphorylase